MEWNACPKRGLWGDRLVKSIQSQIMFLLPGVLSSIDLDLVVLE